MKEKEVILQLKEDDLKKFYSIYNKYYRKIYFLSLKIINDEKLAEDISQEVFLEIISNIKKRNNIINFDCWINKVVINKINKTFKNENLEKNHINYTAEDLINYRDNDYNIEDLILKKMLIEDLISSISKLPLIKKRAIIFYFFYNLSLKEISLIEDVTIETIKSRIYAAKKILKKLIINNNLFIILCSSIKFILNTNCR